MRIFRDCYHAKVRAVSFLYIIPLYNANIFRLTYIKKISRRNLYEKKQTQKLSTTQMVKMVNISDSNYLNHSSTPYCAKSASHCRGTTNPSGRFHNLLHIFFNYLPVNLGICIRFYLIGAWFTCSNFLAQEFLKLIRVFLFAWKKQKKFLYTPIITQKNRFSIIFRQNHLKFDENFSYSDNLLYTNNTLLVKKILY